MNDQEQWEGIIHLMELELGILRSYNETSMSIQASLHAKDWSALELALKRLENLTGDLENFESKRRALSEKLGGRLIGEGLARLPDYLRRRFNKLRFELRASLLRVRSRINGIAAYAESRGRLARELMEVLIPSARGRIYNERGQAASASGNPLVVSHNL